MKYVLDSSVALKWVLPEADSVKALAVRDDHRLQVHELIAPDIFTIEVAHALTRAERRNIIKPPQAMRLLADVLSTPIPFHAYQHLLTRAVAISSAMRCGVYDCLYVALAEREGCEFLTADARLVRTLATTFPFMVLLASWP